MRTRVASVLVVFVAVGCLNTVPETRCVRDFDCGDGLQCIDSRCIEVVDGGIGGGGGVDAGPRDSGVFDAGEFDAGGLDGGAFDGGMFDGGPVDAGAPRCTPANTCLPTGYKFEQVSNCGTFCYHDEAHNIAINGSGQGQNTTGFDQYALGQLLDGIRGNADWTVNTGAGSGFEWVGWLYRDASVIFRFGTQREFIAVTVGINNHGTGAVYAPSEIRVQLGDDGVTFGVAYTFRRSDGSLPAVPLGTRQDVSLAVPGASGRFVRITLVYSAAWTMVDEFAFE